MQLKARRLAFKVALFYVIASAAWILLSDRLLVLLVHDQKLILEISVLKGLGFAVLSGGIMFHLLSRRLRRWENEVHGRQLAEAAQRESEERYRRLFDVATDAILLVDIESYQILEANPAAEKLYGYQPDEFTQLKTTDLSDEPEATRDAMVAQTKFIPLRRHRRKDGTVFLVEIACSEIIFQRRQIHVAVVRDITERQATETALVASRAKLAAALASMTDAVFISDTAGRFIEVNEAFATFHRFKNKSECAKTFAEYPEILEVYLANGELAPLEQWAVPRALRGETATNAEYSLRRKDTGETWTGSYSFSPLRDEQGVITGAVVVGRDITEIKLADRRRQVSEERYQALFESSLDCVFLSDFEGNFLDANQTALNLLGYAREEVEGLTFAKLLAADQLPLAQQALEELIATGVQKQTVVLRLQTRNCRPVFVEIYCSLIRHEGHPFAIQGIARDITQRQQVMAMLQDSTQQLLAAQQLAQLGSYEFNLQTDRWSSSVVLDQLFGIANEDFTKNLAGWLQIVHPADRAEMQRYLQDDVLKSCANFDRNYRIVRQDDQQERWVHGLGKLFFDPEGRVVRMAGTIQDITEQKRAAESLANERLLLRTLVDHLPVAVYLKDAAGRKTLANPVDLRNLGRATEAEVLGQTDFDFFPPEQAANFYADDQQVLQSGKPVLDREEKIVLADGTFIWNQTSKVPLHDATGQIIGLAGVSRDITERKRLEETNERLATAVEQSAESIEITDTEGKILYVNPAFQKTSGYSAAEVLGQYPRILKSGQHDIDFYRRMWSVLKAGETWSGHFINRRKDGTLYEEEANITPVRDAAGKVVNFVAVKRDVTREVQLEAQLRHSQKMEAIGQLAGGVAHDFNNILAVIQLQAGLLTSEPGLPGLQKECAQEIEQAAQRAANLTRQLLLFSRKQSLQLRDLDLNEAVTGISRMLQRVLGENIQMQFKLATHPLLVHADGGMMDQVLMNLTVNARDAMPKGGQLVIQTSEVEFDETTAAQMTQVRPGRFACVSVTDTGSGMPPEILSRIFEPFFTTKEIGKGTGLGLATVFGIVQQHHGWINVYSEVGQGTTFRIYLPRLNQAGEKAVGWSALVAVLGGKETILLVEDDAALRTVVKTSLSRLGYQVLVAADGATAVNLWHQHRDDIKLLLTDLVMPGGLTGKELAAQLKSEAPKLKVIYVSGYSAEVASKDFPLEEGVNFLAKPFEAQKLAQTVRNCLDKS